MTLRIEYDSNGVHMNLVVPPETVRKVIVVEVCHDDHGLISQVRTDPPRSNGPDYTNHLCFERVRKGGQKDAVERLVSRARSLARLLDVQFIDSRKK